MTALETNRPLNTVSKFRPKRLEKVDGVQLYAIPGFDNYGVSKCGKVWSFPREVSNGKGRRKVAGRWLKATTVSSGWYRGCSLLQDGSPTTLGIHRVLGLAFLGVEDGQQIDHIDGDPLNNHLSNLRVASASENQGNTGRCRANTSGHKGVDWNKRTRKWRARISLNGKRRYLGLFTDPEEAARAYDAAAIAQWGEYAQLNFPREERA